MGQYKDSILLRKIANEVKRLRVKHNITQDAFYYDTNIHIARIETGKVNPSISTIKAICDYFDVTMAEFLRDIEISNALG